MPVSFSRFVEIEFVGGLTYGQYVLTLSGLVSFWRYEELTGTQATDSKGTNHGTHSGTTLNQTGLVNDSKAVLFDSSTDEVLVPYNSVFNFTGSYTVEAWVNTTDLNGTLIEKSVGGVTSTHFALRTNGGFLQFKHKPSGALKTIDSDAVINDGVTRHVVCTYDSVTMRMYINGVLQAATLASGVNVGGVGDITMGRAAGGVVPLAGTLDEVALYNRVLTQTEITTNYDARLGITIPTWIDVTADTRDAGNELQTERGMRGGGPRDRVALTGTMSIVFNNFNKTVSDINTTIGYYTHGHPNVRSGFRLGLGIRFRVVYVELNQVLWRGTIEDTIPTPELYGGRTVTVVATDWMNEAAGHIIDNLAVQVNQRSDVIFGKITDSVLVQPPSRQVGVGMDTFAYAVDSSRSETMTAYTEYVRLAESELGQIYIKRDGGIAFEGRQVRGAAPSVNSYDFSKTIGQLPSPRERSSILNSIKVTSHPREVSVAPVVLYRLVTKQLLGPGESLKPFGGFVDTNQRAARVGALSTETLTAYTDYAANMLIDETGGDMTSVLTVTASVTGNGVSFIVTNNSPSVIYLTKLQIRGIAIYDYENAVMTASDLTSRQTYGLRSVNLDMPYQSNPVVAQSAAYYLLGIHKDPDTGAQLFTFCANEDDALMRQAINREISNRIGVVNTALGLTSARGFFVNGVKMRMSEGILFVTYVLAPADSTQYWLLGITGRSELGVTTRLGFGIFQGHTDVAVISIPHQDIAHADTAHTNVAHADAAHGDTGHTDVAHQNINHGDLAFEDVPHADSPHDDVEHLDDTSDVWVPPLHFDSPHMDVGHSDHHADRAHEDTPHTDVAHQNIEHTDGAHQDTAHADVAHGDTAHADVPHGDTPHGDGFG